MSIADRKLRQLEVRRRNYASRLFSGYGVSYRLPAQVITNPVGEIGCSPNYNVGRQVTSSRPVKAPAPVKRLEFTAAPQGFSVGDMPWGMPDLNDKGHAADLGGLHEISQSVPRHAERRVAYHNCAKLRKP